VSRFRILSLDGGGIRGAFTASFLAELEREIGAPIGRYFDLAAGTSTGGIIALAVALGEPASRIVDFYRNAGPKVFTRAAPMKCGWFGGIARALLARRLRHLGLTYDDLFQARYDSAELRRALQEVFGTKTLLHAKMRVLIPAVDLSRGSPVVFKTPHLPDASTRDRNFQAVDIALATAAAPTYFPHAAIGPGSAYSDGGLWANNPVLIALAEVLRLRNPGPRDFDGVQALSVGTGRGRYSLVPPNGAGLAWWGPRLIDVMSLSQSEGTMRVAEFMLGEHFHRVDFDLPDSTWHLDSVEHIEQLIHFGREEAHRQLAPLRNWVLDGITRETNWKFDTDETRSAVSRDLVSLR